ncbi:MAG: cytochrome C [Proteobacteria bacterium]|nr:cytochrome C [Pseudomonadota bacterium]
MPSYARQTGLACEACHTAFPELTPYGRRFKLNGYTIDNLPQVSGISPTKQETLLLNQLPPLSFMFQTSYTGTKTALPDSVLPKSFAKNGQVLFPQQASLFYAGRIAPNLGAFVQMTYDGTDGEFGWDNTDIRFAKAINENLLLGLSLNNNPTVQDPWNSTPAWQVPFDQRSSVAPTPGAATMIDGGLVGAGVAGLTAYAYLYDSVYAELGGYRSAPAAAQIDSTSTNVVNGVAPYWRIAYEHQWGRHSWEIGAYGVVAKLYPGGGIALSGPANKYSDWALDSQYQYIGDDHIMSVTATYIDEKQSLDATYGAGASTNASDRLKTFRIGASYLYQRRYGAALGYFETTGSSDALLYPAGVPVVGFADGSPNSSGWTGELDWLPYENTKLALQYTKYSKFNGGSSNYDGSGRNASDNDTTYLLFWFNY